MSLFDDDQTLFSTDPGAAQGMSGIFGERPPDAQSLSYQPQKQPRSLMASATPAGVPVNDNTLFHHSDIVLFKYDASSRQYEDLGSAGAGLLGQVRLRSLRLVLYLPDNTRVCEMAVSPATKYAITSDLYSSVYDQNKQNWSLKFPTIEKNLDFAKHVALARFAAQGPSDGVLVQDLSAVNKKDTKIVEEGDSVTVQFTAWVLEGEAIGGVVDTKGFDKKCKLHIGDGEVTRGLEQGLLGANKGLKRFVVVPSYLAYGEVGSGAVPPSATVLYQVQVLKVKKGDGGGGVGGSGGQADRLRAGMARLDALPTPAMGGQAGPAGGYGMGVQGMPPVGGMPQPHQAPQQQGYGGQMGGPAMGGQMGYPGQMGYGGGQALMIPQQQQQQQQQQMFNNGMYGQPQQPQQPQVAPQPQPAAAASNASTMQLLIETQNNQGELRMGLAEVANKIGELSVKIDKVDPLGGMGQETRMSGLILLQNIQRIIAENEILKRENTDKSNRIEALTEKISRLVTKNERFIDDSNKIIEDRNDVMKENAEVARRQVQELILERAKAENAMNEALAELAETKRALAKLKGDRSGMRNVIESTASELERTKEELQHLRLDARESEGRVEGMAKQLKEEQYGRKVAFGKVEALQDELEEERRLRAKAEAAADERKRKFNAEVKRIEAMFDQEKAALEEELDGLRTALREERVSASARTKAAMDKIEEEHASKWGALLEQNEATVIKQLQSQHERERAAWEQAAMEQGRREMEVELERAVASAYKRGKNDGQRAGGGGGAAVKRLEDKLRRIKAEHRGQTSASVKTIMNDVYFDLDDRFESGTSYDNKAIMPVIKAVIKHTTNTRLAAIEADDGEVSPVFEDMADDGVGASDDNDRLVIERLVSDARSAYATPLSATPAVVPTPLEAAAPVVEADPDADAVEAATAAAAERAANQAAKAERGDVFSFMDDADDNFGTAPTASDPVTSLLADATETTAEPSETGDDGKKKKKKKKKKSKSKSKDKAKATPTEAPAAVVDGPLGGGPLGGGDAGPLGGGPLGGGDDEAADETPAPVDGPLGGGASPTEDAAADAAPEESVAPAAADPVADADLPAASEDQTEDEGGKKKKKKKKAKGKGKSSEVSLFGGDGDDEDPAADAAGDDAGDDAGDAGDAAADDEPAPEVTKAKAKAKGKAKSGGGASIFGGDDEDFGDVFGFSSTAGAGSKKDKKDKKKKKDKPLFGADDEAGGDDGLDWLASSKSKTKKDKKRGSAGADNPLGGGGGDAWLLDGEPF